MTKFLLQITLTGFGCVLPNQYNGGVGRRLDVWMGAVDRTSIGGPASRALRWGAGTVAELSAGARAHPEVEEEEFSPITIPALRKVPPAHTHTHKLAQGSDTFMHHLTLGARCAPYHLSKQLNISISKVMKCDNWHAWYMIIIQHKITAYSNNTSLIC